VLCIEERLDAHGEAHVPPVRVELRRSYRSCSGERASVVKRPIRSASAPPGPAESGADGGTRGQRGSWPRSRYMGVCR
jgi:hypothetical protein